MDKVWHRGTDFLRNPDGNVTIIFSMALLVMMGVAGVAIDYVRLVEQRTVFAAAADAAVLAGISSAREAERNSLSGIPALARKAAQVAWDRNIATTTLKDLKGPNITVTKKDTAWTATVTYNEDSPTSFISLLGVKSMKVAGEATASTTVEKSPNYWDFHIVIDTSSSMGIGATQADMDALATLQKAKFNYDNCTFACHWSSNPATDPDGVSEAKKANIKLRINVVDDAVDGMIDQLKLASNGSNIRSELWGMDDTVRPLVDLTAKLNDVKNYKIEIYKTPASLGNTNYQASFSKITGEVGKGGDGKSAVSPKKAVFIVTDGIHDTTINTSNVTYVWWSDHQMGTVDPAFCQTMKDNNILVGVLYINYIPPSTHVDLMANVIPSVLPALKSCATDGLFFNATTPASITAAMQDMLKAAMGLGAVRLTQ